MAEVIGDALDIEAELEPRGASAVVLNVRGVSIEYAPGLLKCLGNSAPLEPVDGKIRLRVLVDRTSIEVFANDGAASISATTLPAQDKKSVELFADRGVARIVSLKVHQMHGVATQN